MTKVRRDKVPDIDDTDFWQGIFERIELGATERSLARDYNFSHSSLRNRLNTPELHARYVQAHEGRAILHAHKIEDMLEKLESGEMESDIARVSIDARKWLATKYYPKMFGERQQLEVKTLDVTKVYVEQLKLLMSNPNKRIKSISAIEIEDKSAKKRGKRQKDKEV
tara:strand:- start:1004 stop:1504 length:501 start_codon:yes stop_codon:yes gene_type:complete